MSANQPQTNGKPLISNDRVSKHTHAVVCLTRRFRCIPSGSVQSSLSKPAEPVISVQWSLRRSSYFEAKWSAGEWNGRATETSRALCNATESGEYSERRSLGREAIQSHTERGNLGQRLPGPPPGVFRSATGVPLRYCPCSQAAQSAARSIASIWCQLAADCTSEQWAPGRLCAERR